MQANDGAPKLTALIPARGGSKRLPRKNILPINGKPLLSMTIAHIKQSKVFSSIVVSTEDDEIAKIAKQCGVGVLQRPEAYAADDVGVDQVCYHAMEALALCDDDWFCCVYATAVLLQPETLRASWLFIQEQQAIGATSIEALLGISHYNYHPAQALVKNTTGCLEYLMPQFKGKQSQEYPETWVSNGTLCWSKVGAFKQYKTFYMPSLMGFLIPESQVLDIDYLDDFENLKDRLSNSD